MGLALLTASLSCAHGEAFLEIAPVNADLTIHVVVENPAGSDEKWEVRSDGHLAQEFQGGVPIRIPYLPWPVNGGMIPRTLLAADLGGDGEPVDVLLLGAARPRGSVVRAVPIGLLEVIDRLERDDKVLAVVPGTTFGDLEDVADLEARYPGVRAMLSTWYANSRPGGRIQVQGYGSRAAARRLIAECAEAFDAALAAGGLPNWTRE